MSTTLKLQALSEANKIKADIKYYEWLVSQLPTVERMTNTWKKHKDLNPQKEGLVKFGAGWSEDELNKFITNHNTSHYRSIVYDMKVDQLAESLGINPDDYKPRQPYQKRCGLIKAIRIAQKQ